MGDAKRRAATRDDKARAVFDAADRAGAAMRKLAQAASATLGGDCYVHALIGAALLTDQGFAAKPVVGYAAWRVDTGDSDVIAHTPRTQGYLPPGAQGFSYHAWVEWDEFIIDFTTYQLPQKGAELDAADGGHTSVGWRPDLLVVPRNAVSTFREVAKAPLPGVVYYESRPELLERLAAMYEPDPDDLAMARLLMANPHINLMGPNSLLS